MCLMGSWTAYLNGESRAGTWPIMWQHVPIRGKHKILTTRMSKARISVEWTFKEIKKYYTHVDVTRKMVVGKSPVGLWYYAAALLLNFRTCLYGSQTSRYFNCHPPSLESYMNLPVSTNASTALGTDGES